jgi:hypothetical protein
MIIFDLACTRGHRFEGWFASPDEYEQQSAKALVRCPVCDDAHVTKVPSAKVHVGKEAPRAPAPVAPNTRPAEAVAGIPAELIQQLRALVKGAEDVGTRFPEEARKMHYEEAPARSIRGQASADEAAALRDEGIDFAALPAFLVDESH